MGNWTIKESLQKMFPQSSNTSEKTQKLHMIFEKMRKLSWEEFNKVLDSYHMDKEIKITPPEGYEVDKEHSTFECIKFKPIKELPTTWEEFCKNHLLKVGESWITSISEITYISKEKGGSTRFCNRDEHVLPSTKYAEAMLALCQLIQLRDCYNDGWQPDWTDGNTVKYCLGVCQNRVTKEVLQITNKVMTFKTMDLRDEFLENFKDLIEIAKPLL